MSLSENEIVAAFDGFIKEIEKCKSAEEAKDIDRRIDSFCEENGIDPAHNYFVSSGYGEELAMLMDC